METHLREPCQYLAARIAEALVKDARTHALDVRVHVAATKVTLTGTVSCAERRSLVEEVVSELLPADKELVSKVWVETFTEPTEAEPLT